MTVITRRALPQLPRLGANGSGEAALLAIMAASLAALLCWTAPPGTDFAAHVYQRAVFIHHGFELWNNLWYAGHYSFVTYSVLYYPLAALLGIRPLAVVTVAVGTFAFAAVLHREWGSDGRWSSIAFAAVWAAFVLTGAFPFALGTSLSLLAILALQRGARRSFVLWSALSLAASPLAFLLLAVLLSGVALAGRGAGRRLVWPAVTIAVLGGTEALLWRLFPSGGRYPFSLKELFWALGFSASVAFVTWRVERARLLRYIFLAYGGACIAVFLVHSAVGENMVRLRFVAIPVIVLALSLRGWRPRTASAVLLSAVVFWNVSPLAAGFLNGSRDQAAQEAYWAPAVQFLKAHLTPSYRVEVVGTAGHWEAAYLPQAGIPLTRGWFRQDDFPQNEVLYDRLTPAAYLGWLHALGVRYVVLTTSAADYSARGEAALLRSGRSGLRPMFYDAKLTVFGVPAPEPLIRGPGPARILSRSQTGFVTRLGAAGSYRVAVRYSPYWKTSSGCVSRTKSGMTELTVTRPGVVSLAFRVSGGRALEVLLNDLHATCASTTPTAR